VVNVAAQSCNITSVKPADLNSSVGVLDNGTLNVMIRCRCVDDHNKELRNIKWFYQNGSQVLDMKSVPLGAPYLMTSDGKRIATLCSMTLMRVTTLVVKDKVFQLVLLMLLFSCCYLVRLINTDLY